MRTFNAYARYYDLLYKDKNYEAEAAFIYRLIRKYSPGAVTVLDLGCGTGQHDFFLSAMGCSVTGVDRSAEMLDKAKNSAGVAEIDFMQGDIRTVRLNRTFDAVISLFHVMSYQTTQEDIRSACTAARTHITAGGLFIFDFWYGPAVLTERPVVRIKRLEDEHSAVTRIAKPVLYPNRNVVDVNYQIFIRDKKHDAVEEIILQRHFEI
ncbi:MAG: class I SAM-dependent methyltransferase [Pseudomonadota bacterium]